MIAAGLPLVAVHALLHHRPFGVGGDEESVQVEVKAVLDRGAVNLRNEATRTREHCAVEADAVAELHQFVRGLARVLAAPAADVDSELILQRAQTPLQRANHRRRDAGGVPVHSHYGAEGLEPERVREPLEECIAPVMMDDRLRDDRAERRHAGGQPGWNPAGVKGKIGAAGPSSHD